MRSKCLIVVEVGGERRAREEEERVKIRRRGGEGERDGERDEWEGLEEAVLREER